MTDSFDDGFTLDLTNYKPRRKKRDQEPYPLDGWTYNTSPLDHWLIVTARCGSAVVADTDACQNAEWSNHLSRCPSCFQQERIAKIKRFASEWHAERDALVLS